MTAAMESRSSTNSSFCVARARQEWNATSSLMNASGSPRAVRVASRIASRGAARSASVRRAAASGAISSLQDAAHLAHLVRVGAAGLHAQEQLHGLARALRRGRADRRAAAHRPTSTRRLAASARTASRTTVRLTPNWAASSRSDGSRSPSPRRL